MFNLLPHKDMAWLPGIKQAMGLDIPSDGCTAVTEAIENTAANTSAEAACQFGGAVCNISSAESIGKHAKRRSRMPSHIHLRPSTILQRVA